LLLIIYHRNVETIPREIEALTLGRRATPPIHVEP
jgi:hypothetical protein